MSVRRRMSQFRKTVVKVLVGIVVTFLISILLFLTVFISFPNVRNYVLDSKIVTVVVKMYNKARPWLHIGNRRSCLKKLAKTEVKFVPVPDKTADSGCILKNVVHVSQSYTSYNGPCLMTCSLALAMYTFEKDVIQPLAKKYFDQPVVRINHVGTYNCRPARGSRRLLSEHAYANAIDITSFQLQDGTVISVKQHWKNAGKKSIFLHEIAQQACQRFRKVLTPNYNALHHDHFHFDMGLMKRCGY
jgi:hypothetical protein